MKSYKGYGIILGWTGYEVVDGDGVTVATKLTESDARAWIDENGK